jgi:hypothetical protein
MAEIENQGHHDGEGFKEIALDLWDNKPLLIGLFAVLFVVIYLLVKNHQGTLTASGQPAPTTSQTGASSGTYLIVNDVTPPNVNVTVNAPTGGTTTPPLPPGPFPIRPPIGPLPPTPLPPKPVVPPPPVAPPPAPAARTVMVTPWPTQDSTLWGIGQHYGYGSNWQAIYNANRSQIGSNPNLLRVGMVLTLP